MTIVKLITMAQEAGFDWGEMGFRDRMCFERFADLVAAKEREACAQVCEGFKQGNSATYIDDDWADMCAAAIRARGKP